jgi:hypothetical protein
MSRAFSASAGDEGVFEHDEHVEIAAFGAGSAGVASAHEVTANPVREGLLEDADHALEDLVGAQVAGRLQEGRHRPILPMSGAAEASRTRPGLL